MVAPKTQPNTLRHASCSVCISYACGMVKTSDTCQCHSMMLADWPPARREGSSEIARYLTLVSESNYDTTANTSQTSSSNGRALDASRAKRDLNPTCLRHVSRATFAGSSYLSLWLEVQNPNCRISTTVVHVYRKDQIDNLHDISTIYTAWRDRQLWAPHRFPCGW